jgi:hypothetical protein
MKGNHMPRAGNEIPDGYGREGPWFEGHHKDGEIGKRQEQLNFNKTHAARQKKTPPRMR